MIIIHIIFWVLFMYGLFSLIQDIITEFTYKKYNKHVKVYVCVEDFENQIESIERELARVKWQFKNIGLNIVNFDNNLKDNDLKVFLENSNIQVYTKDEFFKQINNYYNNNI